MAQDTYTARTVVLRKTKLGESDLVVTLLAENGSQIRAVAKGARKPANPFAARLEIASECDVLLARGRSLDIAKEARIVSSRDRIRRDFDRLALAECMLELLGKATQADLEHPLLFPMTSTALDALEEAEEAATAAVLAVAHLLKTFAFVGIRPEFARCVACGRGASPRPGQPDERLFCSFEEGGVVCRACARSLAASKLEPGLAGWLETALRSTFADLLRLDVPAGMPRPALAFCRTWARAHLGTDLKSIGFALSSAMLSPEARYR